MKVHEFILALINESSWICLGFNQLKFKKPSLIEYFEWKKLSWSNRAENLIQPLFLSIYTVYVYFACLGVCLLESN